MNKDFIFGAATSAFQIEGARNIDGKTDSIWDEFCKKNGNVIDSSNGDIACNHYELYEKDIEILQELGVDSYRFSVSWPRIIPEEGVVNQKGIDFYKKIVKKLKSVGIEPMITLYHWDLPMWAYKKGGWLNRDSVKWFSDYASVMYDEFKTDVKLWVTHNEPFCASILGYDVGCHAPGHKDLKESLIAAHNMLLSHGEAVREFRKRDISGGEIGIVLNPVPTYPENNDPANIEASRYYDGRQGRWFYEPLFLKKYPEDMIEIYESKIGKIDFIEDGDFEIISEECDFLGVNFYTRLLCRIEEGEYKEGRGNLPKTSMGWEVYPEGLSDLVKKVRENYDKDIPIIISENGAAFDDEISADGKIHDFRRVEYFERHLEEVEKINKNGGKIAGYYAWSLLDNFEWAFGYTQRFGKYMLIMRHKKGH